MGKRETANPGKQREGEGTISVSSLSVPPVTSQSMKKNLSALREHLNYTTQCSLNQDSSKLEVHGDTVQEAPSTVGNGSVHLFPDGSTSTKGSG